MNYTQTLETLSSFFADAVKFHKSNFAQAIRDIEKIKRDPYKRFGKRLHKEAKRDFIAYLYETLRDY